MDDTISRAAALDALGERPTVWTDDDDYALGERNQYDMDRLAIETVPSAQLAQDLTNGCTDTISRAAIVDAIEGVDWYHMTDSGEMVHGANSAEDQPWYKAEDIYAAIEALPSAQPGCEDAVSRKAVIDAIDKWKEACADNGHKETVSDIKLIRKDFIELPSVTPKQPGWIPCSTALPEYDCEYLVTKKSFGWNCKEYIETDIARYEKKDGWHKADTVLAWCELPTPYREGGQE